MSEQSIESLVKGQFFEESEANPQQLVGAEISLEDKRGETERGRWKRRACNAGNQSTPMLSFGGKIKLIDEDVNDIGKGLVKKGRHNGREVRTESNKLVAEAVRQPCQSL